MWQTIADNKTKFMTFGPYVPAISDNGRVAFQTTIQSGKQGIYVWIPKSQTCYQLSQEEIQGQAISHPDLTEDKVCFYAKQKRHSYLCQIPQGTPKKSINETWSIGPLGPTINALGHIAFRAYNSFGNPLIAMTQHDDIKVIAQVDEFFHGFQGLPVINRHSQVVFRADLQDGTQGIFLYDQGHLKECVRTGNIFTQLGRFPDLNDQGNVLFSGVKKSGKSGLYKSDDLNITTIVESAHFHVRGGLINNHDQYLIFGQTPGEPLGLYTGSNLSQSNVLTIGDSFENSFIAEFALNSVSFNSQGKYVLRIALEDSRELIAMAEL